MNRGDFVGTCMPYSLKLTGMPNRYSILTAEEVDKGAAGPAAVEFSVPAELLAKFQAEGLVKHDCILLYDDDLYPTASDANMKRYQDVLHKLSRVTVKGLSPVPA